MPSVASEKTYREVLKRKCPQCHAPRGVACGLPGGYGTRGVCWGRWALMLRVTKPVGSGLVHQKVGDGT